MKKKILKSNLVGMWGALIVNEIPETIFFIRDKADENYYICQAISLSDGTPNIARLLSIDDLKECTIFPDAALVQDFIKHYLNGKEYPFKFKKRS